MKKTIVENCLVFDVGVLNRACVFETDDPFSCNVSVGRGVKIFVSGLFPSGDEDKGFIILTYNFGDRSFMYEVQVVSTPCQFGGKRYWLVCPNEFNGDSCRQRVTKLYLPRSSSHFLCRHCHDLSYRSRQEWKPQTEMGLLIQLYRFDEKLRIRGRKRPGKRLLYQADQLSEIARRWELPDEDGKTN